MLASLAAGGASLAGASALHAKGPARTGDLPPKAKVKVAFLISRMANVIDTAGPWEVFQDFPQPAGGAFHLFTVAPSLAPVTMTGGLEIKPTYSIENAPQPDVIVVPAQTGAPALTQWLLKMTPQADVVMSVCDGAFLLAEAGLLDGLSATTHHAGVNALARRHPKVDVKRGVRFVDNGRIATSGGLTSGIDLALHIVRRYYSEADAGELALWLEHDSQDWRTGARG